MRSYEDLKSNYQQLHLRRLHIWHFVGWPSEGYSLKTLGRIERHNRYLELSRRQWTSAAFPWQWRRMSQQLQVPTLTIVSSLSRTTLNTSISGSKIFSGKTCFRHSWLLGNLTSQYHTLKAIWDPAYCCNMISQNSLTRNSLIYVCVRPCLIPILKWDL